MIEIYLDLQAVDAIRMDGFPDDAAHPEDIYNEIMDILWGFEQPTLTRQYMIAVGLYLAGEFESSSWRVVAFIGQVEVARMEYILPVVATPRIELASRVSRYERKPVI